MLSEQVTSDAVAPKPTKARAERQRVPAQRLVDEKGQANGEVSERRVSVGEPTRLDMTPKTECCDRYTGMVRRSHAEGRTQGLMVIRDNIH